MIVYCRPTSVTVNKQTTITINNNIWNGNIYTDNSTNLTYIYPQYTTVNENNETVTNISNNPIIYNNETKQYYTYDQTTKNYYYINYGVAPRRRLLRQKHPLPVLTRQKNRPPVPHRPRLKSRAAVSPRRRPASRVAILVTLRVFWPCWLKFVTT
ncbi:hypothetical protein NIA69_21030 [Gemmiger formicilis]|nr:hypothetical protein [Gemmiger formicilis]